MIIVFIGLNDNKNPEVTSQSISDFENRMNIKFIQSSNIKLLDISDFRYDKNVMDTHEDSSEVTKELSKVAKKAIKHLF